MPRKISRPQHRLQDLIREVSPKEPGDPPRRAFYHAVIIGLLHRLKRFEPRVVEALEDTITDLETRGGFNDLANRLGPLAVAMVVCQIQDYKAPTKRKRAHKEWALIEHYHLAVTKLDSCPKTVRNPAHRSVWFKEHLPILLEKMGATACLCSQQTSLPPEKTLNAWGPLSRFPSRLAEAVVAYHHEESAGTMHRRLSQASQKLIQLRTSHPVILEEAVKIFSSFLSDPR